MHNETYTLIDTRGSCHTLQVQADLLVLDQHSVLTVRQAEQVIFATDDGQEIACMPEACWYAVAGADAVPTAAEVGRLLADHLAHWNNEQRLRALVQSLSRLIGAQAPVPILPQPRLDSFIEAALARCEPTPTSAKVAALAQVINQPPALVVAWLQQRGKTVLPPDESPEASVASDNVERDAQTPKTKGASADSQPIPAKRAMFRWTSEMIRQLTAEFLATPLDQSISAAAKAIAERHGWPAGSAEYKIFHLELPDQREARRSTSTPLAQDGEQAELDAVVARTDPASEPDETRPSVSVASRALNLPQHESVSPVELCRGNFVWDVRVDGAVQRWFLDYPYGAFPVQTGEMMFQGVTYALQMVGINTVRATSTRKGVLEEVVQAEVLKVG